MSTLHQVDVTIPLQRTADPRAKHYKPQLQAQTRSIRALFDDDTITLYQAYNDAIATAAVSSQCLSTSPLFSTTRTTWLKPSWAWMLYRAGYSYKDKNQTRILALKIRREGFAEMLSHARLGELGSKDWKGGVDGVVIQWDPERDVRIQKFDGGRTRSIQIGVSGGLVEKLVEEWICGIEDVTERARELKRVLDEDAKGKIKVKELIERQLVPVEKVYDEFVAEDVRMRLGMTCDAVEGVENISGTDGDEFRPEEQATRQGNA